MNLGYQVTHWKELGWAGTNLMGYNIGLGKVDLAFTLVLMGLMALIHRMQIGAQSKEFWLGKPLWLRWGTYYALMTAIILFGVDRANQFIYFQF